MELTEMQSRLQADKRKLKALGKLKKQKELLAGKGRIRPARSNGA